MAQSERQQKTIRQLRQERGWSQLDLALRLRVDASTVSAWERGAKMPRRGMQQCLATVFAVSVEALAFGSAEQVPQETHQDGMG